MGASVRAGWPLRLLAPSIGLLALALAGCGSVVGTSTLGPALTIDNPTHSKANGSPISLREFPAGPYHALMPQGQRMYTLHYWSRGLDLQGYLDVPPGKGPFPVLVYLHGGDPTPEPAHWTGAPVYNPKAAAESANAHSIVFIPNYGGYGPSHGNICSPYDCVLDVENGLKALSHLGGLYVKADATYPFGFSIGGYVAMALAEHDPQVRALVLDSPWPGALAFEAWAQQTHLSRMDAADLSFWGMVKSAFGPNLQSVLYQENSVQFNKMHVPILIIAGTKDNTIPPSLARFLYDRLHASGVEVKLQFVPGGHAPITLHVYQLVQKWLLPQGFHLYIST
ncbi:MAG: prolyl oligopeptidase family serine peptidase [Thermaerobacter sp.]|nr:prolyl oligopeptidase family serine peptidase [Thermaerobacter sp.]